MEERLHTKTKPAAFGDGYELRRPILFILFIL